MSKSILGRHALQSLITSVDLSKICHAEMWFPLDDAAKLRIELILTKDQLRALSDSLCNEDKDNGQ